MNFIQLLFKLQLENEIFSKYSDSDFIKIEKRIKVEKQINPEITEEVLKILLDVIKNHSNNLEILLSQKTLTNVFLEKDSLLNNRIKEDDLPLQPDFKEFFEVYLEGDLNHIIKRKIAKKAYKYLDNLMIYKALFSYDFINDLQELFSVKLAHVNDYYMHRDFSKQPEYDFLVSDYFFKFINHINNKEIEILLLKTYNRIVSEYNVSKKSDYPSFSLVAFFEYKPKSTFFSNAIKENHKSAIAKIINNKSSDLSPALITIGIFIALIIISSIIKGLSSSNDDKKPEETEEFIIKKLKTNEKNLYYYIQNNKLNEPNEYTVITNIKTGDNPFDIELAKEGQKNSDYYILLNNTEHDLIVFNYKLNFETSKGSSIIEKITFVKHKDSIKIFNSRDYRNTFYTSFYMGDSLSAFENKKGNKTKQLYKNKTKQLYKKDGTAESRFLIPLDKTKQIFKVFFLLHNRTVITTNKNKIKVFSKGIRYTKDEHTQTPKEPFFIFD